MSNADFTSDGPGLLKAMLGRLASAVCLIVVAGMMLAACDLFGDQGPEEVRLSLEGAPQEEVMLITSNNFIAQREPIFDDFGFVIRDTTLVRLLTADTTVIRLPFDQRYDIAVSQRFFTRAFRLGEPGVVLRMQGWVDGENRFDRSLGAAPTDTLLQFLYFFSGSDRPLEEPPEF